jgi:hypothetical protein
VSYSSTILHVSRVNTDDVAVRVLVNNISSDIANRDYYGGDDKDGQDILFREMLLHAGIILR